MEPHNDSSTERADTTANEIATLSALIERLAGGSDTGRLATLLVSRGRLLWQLGRRREAINDYTEAASLDPSGPAPALLEHSMDILNFFNPDLYNP